MTQEFPPYVPQNVGELMDYLSFTMLSAPTFVDKTGYLPEQNIETVFYSLTQGLQALRAKLGEERYRKLIDMSNQMRAYFEADPEKTTGDTLKGRELILDMEDMIKARGRQR